MLCQACASENVPIPTRLPPAQLLGSPAEERAYVADMWDILLRFDHGPSHCRRDWAGGAVTSAGSVWKRDRGQESAIRCIYLIASHRTKTGEIFMSEAVEQRPLLLIR